MLLQACRSNDAFRVATPEFANYVNGDIRPEDLREHLRSMSNLMASGEAEVARRQRNFPPLQSLIDRLATVYSVGIRPWRPLTAPGQGRYGDSIPKTLEDLSGRVADAKRFVQTGRFPGPMPVQLGRKDLPQLRDHRYFITEKSDGQRVLLLLLHIPTFPRWWCAAADTSSSPDGQGPPPIPPPAAFTPLPLIDTARVEQFSPHGGARDFEFHASSPRFLSAKLGHLSLDTARGIGQFVVNGRAHAHLVRRSGAGLTLSFLVDRAGAWTVCSDDVPLFAALASTAHPIPQGGAPGWSALDPYLPSSDDVLPAARSCYVRGSRAIVLDGELVRRPRSRPEFEFLAFDCLGIMGSMSARASAMRDIHRALNRYEALTHRAPTCMRIRAKDFYPKAEVYAVLQRIVKDEHNHGRYYWTDPAGGTPTENDGIVLTPDSPLLYSFEQGTCFALLKWKPTDRLSVDFLVENGAVMFGLKGKNVVVPGAKVVHRAVDGKPPRRVEDGVWEAVFNPETGLWEEEVCRTEKKHPNAFNTVVSTVLAQVEALSAAEIADAIAPQAVHHDPTDPIVAGTLASQQLRPPTDIAPAAFAICLRTPVGGVARGAGDFCGALSEAHVWLCGRDGARGDSSVPTRRVCIGRDVHGRVRERAAVPREGASGRCPRCGQTLWYTCDCALSGLPSEGGYVTVVFHAPSGRWVVVDYEIVPRSYATAAAEAGQFLLGLLAVLRLESLAKRDDGSYRPPVGQVLQRVLDGCTSLDANADVDPQACVAQSMRATRQQISALETFHRTWLRATAVETDADPSECPHLLVPRMKDFGAGYDEAAQDEQREQAGGMAVRAVTRTFNNRYKDGLISEALRRASYATKHIRVLDLAAGRGGDLWRWLGNRFTHMISDLWHMDLSGASVREAVSRYNNAFRDKRRRDPNIRLPALKFVECDCFGIIQPVGATEPAHENGLGVALRTIEPRLATGGFALVSVQFAVHYAFTSESSVRTLLRTVSEALLPGGVFMVSTMDARRVSELAGIALARIRAVKPGAPRVIDPHGTLLEDGRCVFGNRIYGISFDSIEDLEKAATVEENTPEAYGFGLGYTFRHRPFESMSELVPSLREFMVPPVRFIRLAAECGLISDASLRVTPSEVLLDMTRQPVEGFVRQPTVQRVLPLDEVVDVAPNALSEEEEEFLSLYTSFCFMRTTPNATHAVPRSVIEAAGV